MIRNDAQLKRTSTRIQEIRQMLQEYRSQYTGLQLELLLTPLLGELTELEMEIAEYQRLREATLEEAIQTLQDETILLDNIGDLLTKIRIAANLTQKELAGQLGWRQSNLSRFESENYHSQTIVKTVELASALGVWLHVTPSLTERQSKVIYRKEPAPTASHDMVSTTSKYQTHEFTIDSQIISTKTKSRELEYA